MIVDSPFISNLALGADRVVPEQGDNQIEIPPRVQPILELLTAHSATSQVVQEAVTSILVDLDVTFLNQGSTAVTAVNLPKGLYTLEYNLAMRSNFTPVPLNQGIKLVLNYQGLAIQLSNWLAIAGSEVIEASRRLLLLSPSVLQVVVGPTNVLATHSYSIALGLNVIRHI